MSQAVLPPQSPDRAVTMQCAVNLQQLAWLTSPQVTAQNCSLFVCVYMCVKKSTNRQKGTQWKLYVTFFCTPWYRPNVPQSSQQWFTWRKKEKIVTLKTIHYKWHYDKLIDFIFHTKSMKTHVEFVPIVSWNPTIRVTQFDTPPLAVGLYDKRRQTAACEW